MRRHFIVPIILFLFPFAATGQPADPKQAMCQASWDRCMATVDGSKNWKPFYDRCVKARTACLGGQAFVPAVTSNFSTAVVGQQNGSGSDFANADPATRNARCERGGVRGNRESCILARATSGYGQSFSLVGPGVPMSRIQRASSVVKCAGGEGAMFYPNGRIESCILDDYSSMGLALTDSSGKTVTCASHSLARFDPEGRVTACN
ncbi:MAG TPA: hypothetical protein VJS47_03150 [Rhizomicrobium sp.]|nr:hypothetical protein [Rhizomicrobium sp.]